MEERVAGNALDEPGLGAEVAGVKDGAEGAFNKVPVGRVGMDVNFRWRKREECEGERGVVRIKRDAWTRSIAFVDATNRRVGGMRRVSRRE